MSKAIPPPTLETFLTKVSESSELQAKVEALRNQPFSGILELSERLAAFSREAGVPVFVETWRAALAHPPGNELSDEALKSLSGGASLDDHLRKFFSLFGSTGSCPT